MQNNAMSIDFTCCVGELVALSFFKRSKHTKEDVLNVLPSPLGVVQIGSRMEKSRLIGRKVP